jgi:[CysO sulfur-carrier protein]-S-L-cysteine hydrolase
VTSVVHPDALNSVYEHAISCFPRECCGFIRASGQVHKARNIQDELHELNPASAARTAHGAFTFSPQDLLALTHGFADPDPPTVIYHSHPNVGAYFSKKDEQGALYLGKLVYPVDFLVIDVRDEGTRGAKLFRYVEDRFECVWSDASSLQDRAT